jgi:hypothetical protein
MLAIQTKELIASLRVANIGFPVPAIAAWARKSSSKF